MEAAGIEPASRDISAEASTCVGGLLGFGGRDPTGRGLPTSWEREFSGGRTRHGPQRFGIAAGLGGLSDEALGPGLPVLRQPKRSYLRQLKMVVGYLRGLLTNHGTPPARQPIRSIPVRPQGNWIARVGFLKEL